MGGAMAKHLLAAGFAVTVYACTPAKAESLIAAGASLADSPAAVAAASDVVFTMVGNPGNVRTVVLDPTIGALAGLRPGGVLVDCTSSSPSLAREIAAAASAAGCYAVDAPVSGGDVGARDGTLAIFAGGDEAVVAWLAPLFAHLGTATHMGLRRLCQRFMDYVSDSVCIKLDLLICGCQFVISHSNYLN